MKQYKSLDHCAASINTDREIQELMTKLGLVTELTGDFLRLRGWGTGPIVISIYIKNRYDQVPQLAMTVLPDKRHDAAIVNQIADRIQVLGAYTGEIEEKKPSMLG